MERKVATVTDLQKRRSLKADLAKLDELWDQLDRAIAEQRTETAAELLASLQQVTEEIGRSPPDGSSEEDEGRIARYSNRFA